ncbi:MAG: tetratricopeptide repeat protein, partial [Bacteroidaceae bacterium]|nr:tetratricopeptide repeat protein [Bacteroidaceae bacterium]
NERLLKNLMQLPFDKVPTAEIYVDYLRLKEVGNDTIAPLLEYILTIEPENQKAQLGLLQIAIDRNDYKEVITRCDTAILYNPEILELYFYKGIACYQEERLQEAIEAYKNGLERRAEDYDGELVSNVYTLLGDTYHEVGNLDACMQAYDSALVYNSENVAVLNNYAYYLSMEGGDLDKAEEMSLITIKSEPENATYIDTYMWILFCKERYQEAKAYADKLLAITKEDADKVLLHHCGDVYAKCGDIERAVELWQRAQSAGDDSKLLTKKIKKRKYYADKKKK